MQFHYVVGFDTDMQKWFVELDTTAYFTDGNVFSPDRAKSGEWGYDGWFVPDTDNTPGLAALDQTLINTLYSLVDVIPIPQEVS